MLGSCTLFFADPFWVALFELTDEEGYRAARYVFGSQPNDAELLQFALHHYKKIIFSTPVELYPGANRPVHFKRRQRQVRRLMAGQAPAKQAWTAVREALEEHKKEKRRSTRLEKEAAGREQFLTRQLQKKEKHKGR